MIILRVIFELIEIKIKLSQTSNHIQIRLNNILTIL
jgi:hypothetical protein